MRDSAWTEGKPQSPPQHLSSMAAAMFGVVKGASDVTVLLSRSRLQKVETKQKKNDNETGETDSGSLEPFSTALGEGEVHPGQVASSTCRYKQPSTPTAI